MLRGILIFYIQQFFLKIFFFYTSFSFSINLDDFAEKMEVDEEQLIAKRREERKALIAKLKPPTPEPVSELIKLPSLTTEVIKKETSAESESSSSDSSDNSSDNSSDSDSSSTDSKKEKEKQKALLLKRKLDAEKEKLEKRKYQKLVQQLQKERTKLSDKYKSLNKNSDKNKDREKLKEKIKDIDKQLQKEKIKEENRLRKKEVEKLKDREKELRERLRLREKKREQEKISDKKNKKDSGIKLPEKTSKYSSENVSNKLENCIKRNKEMNSDEVPDSKKAKNELTEKSISKQEDVVPEDIESSDEDKTVGMDMFAEEANNMFSEKFEVIY